MLGKVVLPSDNIETGTGPAALGAAMEQAEKVARSKSSKKIWIDLDNTPHVPFFLPIIEELRTKGYRVLLTGRQTYQVRELVEFHHLECKMVGRHWGKHRVRKMFGTCWRALRLMAFVARESPDLAVSHGSRSQTLCARLLGIPSISIFDYEFTAKMGGLQADWHFVPELLSGSVTLRSDRVMKYPGLKEDVYIGRFKPDRSLKKQLGLNDTDLIVTMRPPATEAHYHNSEAEVLMDAALNLLISRPQVRVVLLPRNEKQANMLRRDWKEGIANRKIVIPESPVDGANLIWFSDLVISGGGTMNREAAALHIPVYSIFRGRIGAIDRYLAETGRLVLLESVEDVRTKIVLKRREPLDVNSIEQTDALRSVVEGIVSVAEHDHLPTHHSNSQSSDAASSPNVLGAVNTNVEELKGLAVRGLVPMFDADKKLFCHRLHGTERELVREGLSPRYTIMTLLGLRKLEQSGGGCPFDTREIFEAFVGDTSWIRSAGDLGLLLWLVAEFAPNRLGEFLHRMNVEASLDHYRDAREARTTELAWLLAGLAHASLAIPELVRDLTNLAVEAYRRMEENQGEFGFFGHMNTRKSMAGILRGRIGSFADQIYPIYAMAKFATAFQVEEPLGAALECAWAICAAQGDLGQWSWLYDSKTGRVSSRYPVYSVHQHGMAPMGLLALEEATGQCFGKFIDKGLRWIYGSNELGTDMRNTSQNVVWRCLLSRNRRTKYWDTATGLLRSPKKNAPAAPLRVLHEIRPYEFGWLLYAFANSPAR